MTTIELWRAAQDVIDAEERLAWAREEQAAARRPIFRQQADQRVESCERMLRANRGVVAQIVGEPAVDAAVAQRRADVAAMTANHTGSYFDR